MKTWPAKDPDEVLDYTLDWTDRLEDDETIDTSTFELASGGVNIDSSSELEGITTVWLSGGAADEVCLITNRVITSAGRTYEQSVKLRIRSTVRE